MVIHAIAGLPCAWVQACRVGSSVEHVEPGLHDELAEGSDDKEEIDNDDNELPKHGYDYKCAIPGLSSEYRYANAWDHEEHEEWEQGGEAYVTNEDGNHMLPCEGKNEDSFGCCDVGDAVGARNPRDN